jgi:hypothetical protein
MESVPVCLAITLAAPNSKVVPTECHVVQHDRAVHASRSLLDQTAVQWQDLTAARKSTTYQAFLLFTATSLRPWPKGPGGRASAKSSASIHDRLQWPAGSAGVVTKPTAMLVSPVSRRMVMTRLRRLAMTRGPLAVRTWDRSSS